MTEMTIEEMIKAAEQFHAKAHEQPWGTWQINYTGEANYWLLRALLKKMMENE